MSICILLTGGTFDKEYNEITGSLAFKNTHMKEMLELGRCRLACRIEPLMLLDSQEIQDEHREMIIDRCSKAPEDRIVITHGTDTMVRTATEIAKNVSMKTIVLTGAMIPYAFGSSDGLFNLGSALSFVQVLGPGVYIAMNGEYFHWNNVVKNREKGIFETRNA